MSTDDLDPDIAQLLTEAEGYYTGGQWHEAVEIYNSVLEQHPDLTQVYVRRGLLLVEMGDVDSAERDFAQALELNPNYGPAYYGRGWVRNAKGDFEGELQDAQRGLELEPDNAGKYYLRIAAAYHGLKRYSEAINTYTQIISLNPAVEGPIYNRGLCYLDMGQYDRALADFNRALELDPDWDWAFKARGEAHALLGNVESAAQDFGKVVQLSRNHNLVVLARRRLMAIESEQKNQRTGLLGLLMLQPRAYRDLANDTSRDEMIRSVLLVVGVPVILVAAPLAVSLPGTDADRLQSRLVNQYKLAPDQANLILVLTMMVVAPLFWLISNWVLAQVTRLKFIGGSPRFGGLLRTTSYAGVFSLLTLIPNPIMDFTGSALGWIAYIIAISESLRVRTGKAFALGCASIALIAFPLVLLSMFVIWGLVAG